MDRKHCVLFYSKNSQASFDLFNYINNLPIDLPSLTGMTVVCADNELIRSKLFENNILDVPVLLIEYFVSYEDFPKKQKLFKNQIYQWIDEITKKCIDQKSDYFPSKQKTKKKVSFLSPDISNPPKNSSILTNPPKNSSILTNPPKNSSILTNPPANINITVPLNPLKSKDVSSIAAEIAKQRDIEENKLNNNLLVKN
jgi:hypothetical protein